MLRRCTRHFYAFLAILGIFFRSHKAVYPRSFLNPFSLTDVSNCSAGNRKKVPNPVGQIMSQMRRKPFPCRMMKSGSLVWTSTVCPVRSWVVWCTSSSPASHHCVTPTQTRLRSTLRHSSRRHCVSWSATSSPVYRRSSANLCVSSVCMCAVSRGFVSFSADLL